MTDAGEIIFECPKEAACSGTYASYEIDWDSSNSINNWMTDLNLICEPPIAISLMGVLSFISFSLGSILITQVIDKQGRRLSLIVASSVTPLCIMGLMFAPHNLYSIYAVIFSLGLTYNCRGSTAYLYATEFL